MSDSKIAQQREVIADLEQRVVKAAIFWNGCLPTEPVAADGKAYRNASAYLSENVRLLLLARNEMGKLTHEATNGTKPTRGGK